MHYRRTHRETVTPVDPEDANVSASCHALAATFSAIRSSERKLITMCGEARDDGQSVPGGA
jgi:hypothetical protein